MSRAAEQHGHREGRRVKLDGAGGAEAHARFRQYEYKAVRHGATRRAARGMRAQAWARAYLEGRTRAVL